MPVQLIHGDNLVEIEEELHSVRSRFHAADIVTLEGAEMSLPEFTEACLTAGLFDPERLVVVRDLHDRLKAAKKDSTETEELVRIMGSVAPTTTLMLIDMGMPPDHALVPAARSIGATVRNFSTPRRQELSRWIVARGKTMGTDVEPGAADLLAELSGPDTIRLKSELEKLRTYAGDDGQRISARMVAELVGPVGQDSIFSLVDAVADGNRAAAFGLLSNQLEQTSSTPTDVALYVIRMLARQIRILLRIRLAQEAGRKSSEIVDGLKLPRYYADRYFRQAKRLSIERLRDAFEKLAALEFGLKSGTVEPATGLDLLVEGLTS